MNPLLLNALPADTLRASDPSGLPPASVAAAADGEPVAQIPFDALLQLSLRSASMEQPLPDGLDDAALGEPELLPVAEHPEETAADASPAALLHVALELPETDPLVLTKPIAQSDSPAATPAIEPLSNALPTPMPAEPPDLETGPTIPADHSVPRVNLLHAATTAKDARSAETMPATVTATATDPAPETIQAPSHAALRRDQQPEQPAVVVHRVPVEAAAGPTARQPLPERAEQGVGVPMPPENAPPVAVQPLEAVPAATPAVPAPTTPIDHAGVAEAVPVVPLNVSAKPVAPTADVESPVPHAVAAAAPDSRPPVLPVSRSRVGGVAAPEVSIAEQGNHQSDNERGMQRSSVAAAPAVEPARAARTDVPEPMALMGPLRADTPAANTAQAADTSAIANGQGAQPAPRSEPPVAAERPQAPLTPAQTERNLQSVQQQIHLSLSQGVGRASVELEPRELGRVEISILRQGEEVQVSFKVQNAAVRDLIEASAQRLRDSFSGTGLQLTDTNVQTGSQQQRGSAQNDRQGSGYAAAAEQDGMLHADDTHERTYQVSRQQGLIDLRV